MKLPLGLTRGCANISCVVLLSCALMEEDDDLPYTPIRHVTRVAPELGNGDSGVLTFIGPALGRPIATGQTVNVFIQSRGISWLCPEQVTEIDAKNCTQMDRAATAQPLASFTVSAEGEGVQLEDRLGSPMKHLRVTADKPGTVRLHVTATRSAGEILSDSISLHYVTPTALEVLRERITGPGSSARVFPGFNHQWCARALGDDGTGQVPLITSEPPVGTVTDPAAAASAVGRYNTNDWEWPADNPVPYDDYPRETSSPYCLRIATATVGRWEFKLDYASLSRTTPFVVADPNQAVELQLAELPEPYSPTADWVAVDADPNVTPIPEGPIALTVGTSQSHVLLVLTKLADQSLVFGGSGWLSAGPNSIVNLQLLNFTSACSYPWSCIYFEPIATAQGEGTIELQQPNGTVTRYPITSYAGGQP